MGFFGKLFGRKKEEKVEEKIEKEILNEEVESVQETLTEEKPFNEQENIGDLTQEIISTPEAINEVEEVIYPDKPKVEKRSFFISLKEKLFKSREGLFGTLKNIFTGKSIVDGEMYEELEDTLVQSDIGIEMTLKIVKDLKVEVKARGVKKPEDVYPVLKDVLESYLITENTSLDIQPGRMNVILVVGVNGVGKTTTIGKIASSLVKDGKKVVIG
ncbi:MAG: signal recognition particle receptor subunit alpha, partial [Cetobacterium sp.]